MIDILIAFFMGLFFGSSIGIFVGALVSAAHEEDEE